MHINFAMPGRLQVTVGGVRPQQSSNSIRYHVLFLSPPPPPKKKKKIDDMCVVSDLKCLKTGSKNSLTSSRHQIHSKNSLMCHAVI